MRPRKPISAELQLRREVDGLKTTIVCLRREIENRNQYAGKLELVLHQRTKRAYGVEVQDLTAGKSARRGCTPNVLLLPSRAVLDWA